MYKTSIKYKLSMLWIKIKSPFRSIVYRIKGYFEMKYWYWWRDTTTLWYNEDTKKWEKSSKATAKDTIRSWWGADSDLLDMMLLKIDHMYYKIKKDGNHLWQYLDAYVFNEDYATPSDREWALKKSLKSFLDPKLAKDDYRVTVTKNKQSVKLSRWIGNIEEFDGHKLDKLESKISIGKPISEKEQTELEELRELKKTARSESGLIHYYLVHIIPKDKEDKNYYVVEENVDKQIPYKNSKSASYYAFDDKHDKLNDMFLPIPDYKTKESKEVLTFADFESLAKVDEIIKEQLGIELNVESNFITDEQSLEVENSDFLVLSPKVREQVRGRRIDLIHILMVRHAIKKIINHDDYADKYNTWLNKEFDTEEEREADLKRCKELYNEDRKALYHKLADILAEYGETFWD